MDGLKIGVIGSGSTYTPELIEGFIKRRDEFSVAQIVMMDIDRKRLEVVGTLARRMFKRAAIGTEIVLTQERKEAIDGADFVITQIRVGGMEGRARDEKFPLKFHVIGQETTGPGGFAMALRTIPVLVEMAHEMETLSPQGWMINFTNPSGLITEALSRHTQVDVIGLCNAPITYQNRLASLFHVSSERIWMDYFGLNHLTWIRKVYLDGQDVTQEVLLKFLNGEAADLPGYPFNKKMVEALGMIPCGYLQYFYHRDQVLEKLLRADTSRAEVVMEIDRQLMELYKDPTLNEKPKILEQRGGAWYSDAAVALISAICNNKGEVHIVNTLNRCALGGLPGDSVVEVPAFVSKNGPQPLVIGELPLAVRGLVQQMKAYEMLTVEAAVQGSRDRALLALANHPLVPSVDVAEKLLDQLLKEHQEYLPRFRQR